MRSFGKDFIMFVDMLGKTRAKIALHVHTTRSDGDKTPEEAVQFYIDEGYDAVALTDHWHYNDEEEIGGLKVLSGCEYNLGDRDGANGVYHILGIGMTSDPAVPEDWKNMIRTGQAKAAEIIKMIRYHNGLSIVAHPAWSLNTAEQLLALGDFDALEIYNAVSECGMSNRPDSSVIADQLAILGKYSNLVAADDAHHYTTDVCRSAVMVESTDMDTQSLVRAIRAGRFYATQGPEVHLVKIAPDKVRVYCSPVSRVIFASNLVWARGRIVEGDGIIEAEYSKFGDERYVRAEVISADGKRAWSNMILFDEF